MASAWGVGEVLGDPDDEVGLHPGCVGDDLAEVGVVGAAVLVLDGDDAAVVGQRPEVEPVRTDGYLGVLGAPLGDGLVGVSDGEPDADRFGEQVDVFGEPRGEVGGFAADREGWGNAFEAGEVEAVDGHGFLGGGRGGEGSRRP